MKYLKTYEDTLRKLPNDRDLYYPKRSYDGLSGSEGDSIYGNNICLSNEIKRKIKHFKDYISKSNKISVDREVPDEKKLISDVHELIMNLGKFHPIFPKMVTYHLKNPQTGVFDITEQRKKGASFSLKHYDSFIEDYGHYPTNINLELLRKLYKILESLENEKYAFVNTKAREELFDECVDLYTSIKHQFFEFDEDIKKYNL
jgi:hypothetical protein